MARASLRTRMICSSVNRRLRMPVSRGETPLDCKAPNGAVCGGKVSDTWGILQNGHEVALHRCHVAPLLALGRTLELLAQDELSRCAAGFPPYIHVKLQSPARRSFEGSNLNRHKSSGTRLMSHGCIPQIAGSGYLWRKHACTLHTTNSSRFTDRETVPVMVGAR